MNCHHRSLTSTKYLDVDETVFKDKDNVCRGDTRMGTAPIPGQDDDNVDRIIFDVVNAGYFGSCGPKSTIFSAYVHRASASMLVLPLVLALVLSYIVMLGNGFGTDFHHRSASGWSNMLVLVWPY